MALKFLNKKGWHTGSLRNIENVWKAEQKHEAEQRKLEELRKQIQEERERDEFRLLQERAGLTPRQERLEFLYDSGLAVGRPSSEGFKALETYPTDKQASASASASPSASASGSAPASSQSAVPGALFEEKPQSANDAWRKLHSDPLLIIRQREQEALARIKNNPVKMAMIRKSVEGKKKDDDTQDGEHQKVKKKHRKHSSSKYHSDSEDDSHEGKEKRKRAKHKSKEHLDSDEDWRGGEEMRKREKHRRKEHLDSDEDSRDRHHRRSYRDRDSEKQSHSGPSRQKVDRNEEDSREGTRHHRHGHRDHEGEKRRGSPSRQKEDRREDGEGNRRSHEKPRHQGRSSELDNGNVRQTSDSNKSTLPPRPESYKRLGRAPQLSEEERAARLREMQMDAEVHEEQRWKRLKKADEDDAREASHAGAPRGRSFLDAVQRSVYGAEKGGSSTIEESVRRRSYFLQGGREGDERNAFRR